MGCLVFGPRPEDLETGDLAEGLYHPQVWTYLALGLALLLALLVVEHAESISNCLFSQRLHYFALPMATGLAFALEKGFNTEIGFVRTPAGLEGLREAPLWCSMVASIAFLGLTDFYLNLRGAAQMPVQVFLPTSFALATSLQFFQSIAIFGEFSEMSALNAGLSLCGALISLGGTLLIQPPRLDLLGRQAFEGEELLDGECQVE